MFIQAKKVKGIIYFYLIENKWVSGSSPDRNFEKCLGNHVKVDALFQHYSELKKSWVQ